MYISLSWMYIHIYHVHLSIMDEYTHISCTSLYHGCIYTYIMYISLSWMYIHIYHVDLSIMDEYTHISCTYLYHGYTCTCIHICFCIYRCFIFFKNKNNTTIPTMCYKSLRLCSFSIDNEADKCVCGGSYGEQEAKVVAPWYGVLGNRG